MHISIAAEKLFSIGPLPVTNSLLVTWITILIFLAIGILVRLRKNIVPTGLQNVMEWILEYIYQTVCDAFEDEKKGRKYFPLIMTIFLFVLLINWIGLLPGFGSIGFFRFEDGHEVFVPLFRGASADLNTTLALALISVFMTQVYSIQSLGLKKSLHRFFRNPFKNFIMFFVGMLELIAELAKIISFTFRLFGNIFAGEVLLIVMLTLTKFIVPVPFLFLEVFVGLIQALIFSLLTLFFIKIATTAEEH
jgi:F-type H+-transporting ATPase subunit a